MKLHSDDYDPEKECESLIWRARNIIGPSAWRMVGPEVEDFIRFEVREALIAAFSKAEALGIRDQCNMQQQYSKTLLEGVLAGATIGRQADNVLQCELCGETDGEIVEVDGEFYCEPLCDADDTVTMHDED